MSGKISKRPAIIAKEKTHLEKSLNAAKLPFGPTAPSPGPMLLNVAATELKVVVKSRFSKEIKSTKMIKVKTYKRK